jgi:cobalt/nickel transport system ATP-binding protein
MTTAVHAPSARLDIEDLRYAYAPGREVLSGVTLHLEPGEHVLLAGRSGAGKSTLGLHLNGILLPQSGAVRIDGQLLTSANLSWARGRVGIVFQDPEDQLFTPTVREDVEFGPLNQGLSPEEAVKRAAEALDLVQLSGFESRLNHELSYGEKRRAALATVLAMQPGLIVFDEPFANLDPAMVEHLAGIIRSLPVTVLLISQEILPALACCDRMIVLANGRVEADGPALNLASNRPLLAKHGLDFHFYGALWERLAR